MGPAPQHWQGRWRGWTEVAWRGQQTPPPSLGLGSQRSQKTPRMADRRKTSQISPWHHVRPSCSSLVSLLEMVRAQESPLNSLWAISCAQSRTSKAVHSSLTPVMPPPSLSPCTSACLSSSLYAFHPAGKKVLTSMSKELVRQRGSATPSPGRFTWQVGFVELMA